MQHLRLHCHQELQNGHFGIIVFKSIACSECLEVQGIHAGRPCFISTIIYDWFLPTCLPVLCAFVRTCVCPRLLLTAVCLVAAQLAVHFSVTEHQVVGAGVFSWHRGLKIYVLIIVTAVTVGIVVVQRPAGAIPNCQRGRVGSVRPRRKVISWMFWMSN